MATITPPDYTKTAGIPSQGGDTIVVTPEGLVTGSEPGLRSEDMTVAASQTIAARTPLGVDGSGNIIPAVLGTTQAIGFCLIDIATTSSSTLTGYPITRSGCFNPAMLNWPVSYDTMAKKLAAFRGAPTPTNIIMRPVKAATVVLP